MNFRFYTISSKGFLNKTYLIDENELPAFEIKKANWFVKEYKMINPDQTEILTIQADFKLLGARYTIYKNKKVFATVEKEAFDSTFHISTPSDLYSVEKTLLQRSITFLNGIEEIAKMSYNLSKRFEKVKVAIVDTEDQELILALSFIMLIRLIKKRKKKKKKR